MALRKLVTIAVRTRGAWPYAVLLSVAALTVGCSHNRQSYRPIYTTRGAVSAPCTTCGGSAATVTTPDSVVPPVSSGTPLSDSSTIDSTVPALPPSSRSSNGSSRGAAVESTPRASIGGPPDEVDDLSPTTGQRTPTNPYTTKKPAKQSQLPPIEGPTPPPPPAPTTWNADPQGDAQVAASASKLVRRTSVTEQLRPFVDDSSANELAYPNKADRPWRYIVLHHSANAEGNYDQIDREHRKILGFDGCGYHFVIGNGTGSDDGKIEIAQRWTNQKQGIHCRNARTHDVDEYGIGICLVGDFDQEPPTPRQIAAAKALVAYLSQRYSIAQGKVTTHVQLATTPTVCPGKYFPAESILPATKAASRERTVRTTWHPVRESSKTY
jgi:N-acetyl-anhydromuramyl-L-alanine amidase AmpD